MSYIMYSYFLDVGQGDCTYLELWDESKGKYANVLVDFGYKERQFTGETPADSALIALVSLITKISKAQKSDVPLLDHLFVTHPDSDHWNMLSALVLGESPRLPNRKLWEEKGWPQGTKLTISQLTYGGDYSAYQDNWYKTYWWGNITKASEDISDLADMAHDQMAIDGSIQPSWSFFSNTLNIYLLSSNVPKKKNGAPNPKSLVLMFQFSGQKLLLLGDAEPTAIYENYLKEWYEPDLTFLNCKAIKLAHHGSRNGTPDWWAEVVKPEVAFVSGDYYWSHPYYEAISNIQKANTIAPDVKLQHWMTSYSDFLKDYNPLNTTKGIFSSLWYVVTAAKAKALDANGTKHTYKKGWYFGASFLMQWYDDGTKPKYIYAPENIWPGPSATVK